MMALLISTIGLFVIGGPIANAMFQSPLEVPALPATAHSVAPAAAAWTIPPLASQAMWIIFGIIIGTGIVLTLSRRSSD